MLLAPEWGRLSENRILRETNFEAPPPPKDLTGHPGCLTWVYNYLLAEYREPARLVACPDGSVLMWCHHYEHGFVDYLMYPFTSRLNGFARDHRRIKVTRFIQEYNETDGAAIFDFRGANHCTMKSERPCYYIGGRENFLHWLIDHLSLALLPEGVPYLQDASLVTNRLARWQKETLKFFGVTNPVIELFPLEAKSTFFHFENLIVPVGYPLAERFRALRRRYAQLHGQPQGKGANIYLSRGAMRPRHRVANEEDVAAYFTSIGFLVLYPEQMPLSEIANYCANADIIATAPGSANGNFFVFAGDEAVLIYMVPEFGRGQVNYFQATVGYANLLIFIDRLVTVFGRNVGADKPTQIDEDRPEYYDPAELAQAVAQAKSMVEARRRQKLLPGK
jgi:hypothetical protein